MRILILIFFTIVSASILEPRVIAKRVDPSSVPLPTDGSMLCLGRQEPPAPPLPRVSWEDCSALIKAYEQSDKRYAVMPFTRDGKIGFKLPHTMKYRSCVIEMFFRVEDGEEDVYNFHDLAVRMQAVVYKCVMELGSFQAGGATTFGRKAKMALLVRGFKAGELEAQPVDHVLRNHGQALGLLGRI